MLWKIYMSNPTNCGIWNFIEIDILFVMNVVVVLHILHSKNKIINQLVGVSVVSTYR